MRKCLLFVALLLVSQIHELKAQFLFDAPDTVCIKQPVKLKSNNPGAATHYWGFCSGYLFDIPDGYNFKGEKYNLYGPTAIEIAKQGDNYFGFVANSTENSFLRLAFGNDLSNDPVVTNFGTMGGALPSDINTLTVVYDDAKDNWHVFVGGGLNSFFSQLGRIDFGHSLDSTPNIVNFGNLQGLVAGPRGLFVAKEDDKWYGFFLNLDADNLIKMEFDTNLSLTPTLTDLGGFPDPATPLTPRIITPTDMAVIKDNGRWYFYTTNTDNNYLDFLFVGPSLAAANSSTIKLVIAGNPGGAIDNASGISVIKDCDSIHLFITNKAGSELLRLDLINAEGFNKDPVNYGNVGGIIAPTGLSRLIRDRDKIYTFITNFADSSITKITFDQCTDATIQSSTTYRPPQYSYQNPGYYNVYYATNEGLPDMQTECRQIAALPIPSIIISNDTTICQGDTLNLTAYSVNALSTTWTPNHNLSNTNRPEVRAWPDYTEEYHIVLPYSNGCIVDTPIRVDVHKIKADAGTDRALTDGGGTTLGGPFTSLGQQYSYRWFPNQYISDPLSLNPVAKPPYDFTYYIEVRDTAGCLDVDTVKIYVQCTELNLPNAFVPGGSNNATARFGIANYNIAKLNYFRVFDRWGKEVFNTTDPIKQWDGTVNGSPALMGVYVWEADGFCVSGQRLHAKGNVTLIR